MAEKPLIRYFAFFALVNWTQIGNVIDRPSQFPMRGGQGSAVAAARRRVNLGHHFSFFWLLFSFFVT